MMKSATAQNPATEPQTTYCPPVSLPQGDGSFVVKPGKPVTRLSPKQFAVAVGLARNTVYEYIGTEAIPERFVDFAGARKIEIHAEAVAHFKVFWRNKRLHGLSGQNVEGN